MTSFGEHLGEYAELYALGVLEPDERLSVERHLAECVRCTREVGQAEATVAALDDATIPQVEPPAGLARRLAAAPTALGPPTAALKPRATFPMQLAVAASIALVVGLGGGILVDRGLDGARPQVRDEEALRTIAASHFLHASFQPALSGAPTAKVLYARDGSWLYVVVDASVGDYRVVARSHDHAVDLGALRPGAATSTLFVRNAPSPQTVELVRGGQVIETATLARLSN
jgi:anti-sigma factor RsiW